MGINVLNPGVLTTIQDNGRYGFQQFGVPVSGVMDKRSFVIGNILVGNADFEPALEATMMGPTLEIGEDVVIAVTGGDLSPLKNGAPLEMYRAHAFKAGDTLSFGIQKTGCRAYIAFSGGFDLVPVMGSSSTYLKAKLGGLNGNKLSRGDVIGLKAPTAPVKNLSRRFTTADNFSATEKVLRVIMGPQDDCFTAKGIETFFSAPYNITNQSDRMGCRLEGTAVEHIKDGNIISDGISMGAIQIPSEGQPIVMLADRQTTGGYTKIANVITVDFPKITQGKFGDSIRFEKVSIAQAQDLYLKELAELSALREKLDAESTHFYREYTVRVGNKVFNATVQSVE